jgi:hypothetical protein
MYAFSRTAWPRLLCGNYATANAFVDELIALAEEKGTLFWKAGGMMYRGWVFVLTGKASDAIHMTTAGITAWRSTGATGLVPPFLSNLARAYA